jgi:hypothetical protein
MWRVTIKLLTPFLFVAGSLAGNAPAIAHHGTNTEYDSEHPITFQAKVTEVAFSNPHVQIYFDAKNDKGNLVHWAVEAPSPGRLMRTGWTRNEIRAGDQITIVVEPARSGANVGSLRKLVLANGKELAIVHGNESRPR